MRRFSAALLFLTSLGGLTTFAAPIAGFDPAPLTHEQTRHWTTADQVRIVVNAPADFDAARPTSLILYALPNGNTIEQTMGAKLEPGMNWHYDIQHIAAQVRLLRTVDKDENVVVACLEANTKSWPAWRAAHPDNARRIRAIVQQVSHAVPGPDIRVALTAHSGGGSLIFGYLNGGDAIAGNIVRIAWLDAVYAYDDASHHGDKLLAWLKSDPKRDLVVISYNDANVKFNGKNIVSPTGGTFYRSHKMIERLEKDVKLTQTAWGPFEKYVGMNGQIHFLLNTNPENRILHTVLVERNGLIEAMTLGTPMEDKWGGQFWGARAYTKYIAAAPKSATQPASTRSSDVKNQVGVIPERAANALGGKAFCETIADLPPEAREAAIVQEFLRGNVPAFERKFVMIRVSDGKHSCAFEVMPDYLAVGSDHDFVRMPMTPASAKQIADAFGCTLPTRKMVNEIYAHAKVKLAPQPLTENREAVRMFVQHNDLIEKQRAGKPLGLLVAGDKKDIVITPLLKTHPGKVAIYGWHKLDGKPIQPLYLGHGDFYADYSHGIRLVKQQCTVDGKPTTIEQVLKNPRLCVLLSDEGVVDFEKFYTTHP